MKMNNSEKSFDAVVVGGGMVGAAAALGLAQHGFSVALIENESPAEFDASAPVDLRISAIGCASVRFLQKLGVWSAIEKMRSTPYRRLETWKMKALRSFSMRLHWACLNWVSWWKIAFCSWRCGNNL